MLNRRSYLAIVLLAIGIRIPLIVIAHRYPDRCMNSDSKEYITLATNLIRHGVFSQLNLDDPAEAQKGPKYWGDWFPIATEGPYEYDAL